MNSKSSFTLLAALVLLGALLACSFGPSVNPVPTVPLVQAPTITVEPTSQPAAPGVPVSFANVSFVIPDGLGSGALSESAPAVDEQSGAPWDVAPAFSRFTLQGYPLQGKLLQPTLFVYPAQDYVAVNNGAQISLQRLQAILSNPATPLEGKNLPQVPAFNAQMIAFRAKTLDFQNGAGVSVVAEYSQAVMPINNQEIFYQFIGLTGDGKYLVIAVLPVNAPFLAATDDPSAPVPSGGVAFPDINTAQSAEFDTYYRAIGDKMNAADQASFTPTLTTLDQLLQSIRVSP
jgi:hypothetical protein